MIGELGGVLHQKVVENVYQSRIVRFVNLMDNFHTNLHFPSWHTALRQNWENNKEAILKLAIDIAYGVEDLTDVYDVFCDVFEKWLKDPSSQEMSSELNACRMVFQVTTSFKLAEAWKYFKEGGTYLQKTLAYRS